MDTPQVSIAGKANCVSVLMGFDNLLRNQINGLSGQFAQRAMVCAIEGFAQRTRKRPTSWPKEEPMTPYFSHLLEVAILLATFD